jgi:hypothetical protein
MHYREACTEVTVKCTDSSYYVNDTSCDLRTHGPPELLNGTADTIVHRMQTGAYNNVCFPLLFRFLSFILHGVQASSWEYMHLPFVPQIDLPFFNLLSLYFLSAFALFYFFLLFYRP